MKNPLVNISKKGLDSPVTNRIRNPLANGSRAKRTLGKHNELLRKAGVKPPKSPLR